MQRQSVENVLDALNGTGRYSWRRAASLKRLMPRGLPGPKMPARPTELTVS